MTTTRPARLVQPLAPGHAELIARVEQYGEPEALHGS